MVKIAGGQNIVEAVELELLKYGANWLNGSSNAPYYICSLKT